MMLVLGCTCPRDDDDDVRTHTRTLKQPKRNPRTARAMAIANEEAAAHGNATFYKTFAAKTCLS